MYLDHWRLADFPFESIADPIYFFEAEQQRMIMLDMTDAIMRRKGALMLTGDIGCGKSTITQRVLLSLPEERFDIAFLTYSSLSPLEMLREINLQLGVDADSQDKNELLHALQDHLSSNASAGRDTVICIDEAQSIPSLGTFEELRLLLNFQLGNRFLITLVFVGQPELKRRIDKLPQLHQRIALQLHLGPLSSRDTTRYILHRLRAAGNRRPILSKQAGNAMYRHTNGVPRRINHLADRCLLLGMRKGSTRWDSKLVTETVEAYPF